MAKIPKKNIFDQSLSGRFPIEKQGKNATLIIDAHLAGKFLNSDKEPKIFLENFSSKREGTLFVWNQIAIEIRCYYDKEVRIYSFKAPIGS